MIDPIAAHCESCAFCCSSTIRTARSRTSGEYRLSVFMPQSSQSLEPPENPGRFIEALDGFFGLPRQELTQIAYAMAAQAAVQTRARHVRADELSGDGQQVIQGQQQGASKLHNHSLLGLVHGRLQPVGRVRAVMKLGAPLPTPDGHLTDAVAPGQHRHRLRALVAISARTAGVVRAILCKAIIMTLSPLRQAFYDLPQHVSGHEQTSTTEVYLIIRDATDSHHTILCL